MVDNQTNPMSESNTNVNNGTDEKTPSEEGKPTKPKEDVEISSMILSDAEEETEESETLWEEKEMARNDIAKPPENVNEDEAVNNSVE